MSFLGGLFDNWGVEELFSGLKSGWSGALDWMDGTRAMRKQNEMNIENWNMQNAYNTPAAQMQRYQEAGLNPNLIYNQSNTAGSIASAASPESGASVIGKAANTLAQIYGLKSTKADIANKEAMNENFHAQNSLLGSQTDYTKVQAQQAAANIRRTDAETDRFVYETDWLKKHDTSSFEDSALRSVKGNTGVIENFKNSLSSILSEHLYTKPIPKSGESRVYYTNDGQKVLIQEGSLVNRPPESGAVVTRTNTGNYVYDYGSGKKLIYVVQ